MIVAVAVLPAITVDSAVSTRPSILASGSDGRRLAQDATIDQAQQPLGVITPPGSAEVTVSRGQIGPGQLVHLRRDPAEQQRRRRVVPRVGTCLLTSTCKMCASKPAGPGKFAGIHPLQWCLGSDRDPTRHVE
jgi:hypothetical protein